MVKLIHIIYPKAIRIADNEGLLPLHKAAEHASLDVIKVWQCSCFQRLFNSTLFLIKLSFTVFDRKLP